MMIRFIQLEEIPLKKGVWSSEEDEKLIAYINRYGIWNWNEIPKAAGLHRTGKSCRLRWMNYLRPDIKHGNFSEEEDEIILTLHQTLGNRWSAIAAKLPGRTDNEIKNHWHSHLNKRLNNNNNNFAVQKSPVKEKKSPENVDSHFTILDSSSSEESSYKYSLNSNSSNEEHMGNMMNDHLRSVNFSSEFYEMLDQYLKADHEDQVMNYIDDEMLIDDDDDDQAISSSGSSINSSQDFNSVLWIDNIWETTDQLW